MPTEIFKNFISEGYLILDLFTSKQILSIEKKIGKKVFKRHNLKELKNLRIINYYLKKISDDHHKRIVSPNGRFIKFDKNELHSINNNATINSILNDFWLHKKYNIKWIASTIHHPTIGNAAGYRIARPVKNHKKDVSGSHIDLHYGAELRNNLKKLITIWCPINGFSKNYTLRFAPGSHLINHPTNIILKQKNYITPVFSNDYSKKFKFIRPNLKLGQAIIFHPNLLHGGSVNEGKKIRISIDFRLFNRKEKD